MRVTSRWLAVLLLSHGLMSHAEAKDSKASKDCARQSNAPWDVPEQNPRALRLVLETDAAAAKIHGHQLPWATNARRLVAPGGAGVASSGAAFRRRPPLGASVKLTVDVSAFLRGDQPAVHAKLTRATWAKLTVYAGRRVLARGRDRAAPGAGRRQLDVTVPLSSKKILSLRPSPVRGFRKRALAFYYGWYGRRDGPSGRWLHWRVNRKDRGVRRKPKLGYYDSLNSAVVERHVQWAKQAGLDGFVVSWWNEGKRDDQLLRLLLEACDKGGLKLSVYVEDGRSVARLRRAMKRLRDRFMKHPGWLRQDGRPVVFFYSRVRKRLKVAGLARAVEGLGLFTHVDSLAPGHLRHFDALHAYYTHTHPERYVGGLDQLRLASRVRRRLVTATVSPGYDDRLTRRPAFVRPRLGGATYRDDQAVAAGADWVLITSWNEWHEDSQIEPSEDLNLIDETAQWLRRWRRQ